ncbi:hypothetical protein PG984_014013 [Apiospora sp. TS-2023a]
MAEVVGLVASVIGITELAAKIVKISFKVKDLLEQVSNVPQELQRHLDQIRLVSPLLANHINDDGPPALRGALGVAIMQCQQAADDLETIAAELHAQVHEGGRARRKLRAAGIVLQKDVLASHEKRMSSAMQMLMMACQMYGLEQQRYLIDLQRRQPEVIVARVLESLGAPEATPAGSLPSNESMKQYADLGTSQNYAKERRTVIWDQAMEPGLKLGLAGLTGSLEVQNGNRVAGRQKGESDLRLRIYLPRWFSSKYIDSILRRSQAGWSYYIHSATLHSYDSVTWRLVMDTMRSKKDSLQKLKSMIGEGRISIYDTRQSSGRHQETLMETALNSGNWQICDFLAGYDVPISAVSVHFIPWAEREDNLRYIQNVASHYENGKIYFWALFQKYDGPIANFDAIRRAVWPDCEFYDASFVDARLFLAALFTQDSPIMHLRSVLATQGLVVRSLLSRNGEINLHDIGTRLLGYCRHYGTKYQLQRLLALLVTKSLRTTRDMSDPNYWAQLTEEVVRHIVESLTRIAPAEEPAATVPLSHSVYSCLFDISIMGDDCGASFGAVHGERPGDSAAKTARRLFRQYLAMLLKCGIDLLQYGLFIESKLKGHKPVFGRFPETDFLWDWHSIEIQDIRVGDNPEEWDLLFVDRADTFAGEFWQLVDPAPLYIPGGWVDED